jgi:plasmid stabilization system protein ParE
MKPASVHPEAEAEADEAFEWYWSRSESAALAFNAELRGAFGFLQRSPQMCALYLRETRRVLLHRFPYFVVFRELPRKIQIIAVAHAKRRPGYWRGRI